MVTCSPGGRFILDIGNGWGTGGRHGSGGIDDTDAEGAATEWRHGGPLLRKGGLRPTCRGVNSSQERCIVVGDGDLFSGGGLHIGWRVVGELGGRRLRAIAG